jgi:hypothetical protein
MSILVKGSFLLIFLTFFSQFSKYLVSYCLYLPDRMFRQVTILSKRPLYLLYLIHLSLILSFIMANFDLQFTFIIFLLNLLNFIHKNVSTTSTGRCFVSLI